MPFALEVQRINADHLGTPRAITRPSDNQVVWKWDSTEPFGNNAANENPSGLGAFPYNLRHPGQYADAETGTFYNYFRDYDPSTGRYRQSDPIGLDDGPNTYAYVGSDPLALNDPLGLKSQPAMEPGQSYKWEPSRDDILPEHRDMQCELICVTLKMAIGFGVGEGFGNASLEMRKPHVGGQAGKKVGRVIRQAKGFLNIPPVALFNLKLAMEWCQNRCLKPSTCAVPFNDPNNMNSPKIAPLNFGR